MSQAKLYSDYTVAHMPSASMQGLSSEDTNTQEHTNTSSEGLQNVQSFSGNSATDITTVDGKPAPADTGPEEAIDAVDCCSLLANAPVHGDHYNYHVDADPLTLPDSDWRRTFGDYCNRCSNKLDALPAHCKACPRPLTLHGCCHSKFLKSN